MKTRPNTTACLKLVVLGGGSRRVMVARATTGRNCEPTVSIGRIAQHAGCLVEFAPPLTRGRAALEFGAGRLVLRWR
jgi:hypothetical protein